jgi:MFS family permease
MGDGTSAALRPVALRSPRLLKETFASLGIPAYRNLWYGSLLQMGSMQMQMLAMGYLVFDLTGSPSRLGVVMAVSAVPALTLALAGGVLADRFDNKRIIQGAQLASLLNALFIAIAISTGTITWQLLMVASLVTGAMMPLMMPARQAIVPRLVGMDRLMNAVALNSLAMSGTTMVAPALAGAVIASLGIDGAYYLMVGLNVGAILFTERVPSVKETARPGGQRPNAVRDVRDGFRYLGKNRGVLALLLLASSTMILAMPLQFMMPIFAKDVFKVGPQGLGLLMSAIGTGSLLGALFIAAMSKMARRGVLLVASGIVAGAALLAFSTVSYIAPAFWAGILIAGLIGVVQSGRMTLNNSLIMEYCEDRYRGRVMGVFSLNMAMMPASVLPVTIVAEAIGAPLALGITSTLLIAISGAFLVGNRHLRALQ